MLHVSFWNNPATKDAYKLSIGSFILEIIAFSVGFCIYNSTSSSISLIYVSNRIAAIVSSTVILWRFFAPFSVDEELERKLTAREENASVAMHFIFFFGSSYVYMKSLVIMIGDGWDLNFPTNGINALFALSSFALTIMFSLFSKIKWHIGCQLGSPSLVLDSLLSAIGAAVSAFLFIHSVCYVESLRWIEPSCIMGWFFSQLSEPSLIEKLGGVLSQYKQKVSKDKCLICCCCATNTGQSTTAITDASLNDVEHGNLTYASSDIDKEHEDSPNATFDIGIANAPNNISNLRQEK